MLFLFWPGAENNIIDLTKVGIFDHMGHGMHLDPLVGLFGDDMVVHI